MMWFFRELFYRKRLHPVREGARLCFLYRRESSARYIWAAGETGLPESNVLYYDMNDGAWLCIRPSGTEPKIKFYYGVKGTSLDDAEAKSKAVGDELMGMVDKMM